VQNPGWKSWISVHHRCNSYGLGCLLLVFQDPDHDCCTCQQQQSKSGVLPEPVTEIVPRMAELDPGLGAQLFFHVSMEFADPDQHQDQFVIQPNAIPRVIMMSVRFLLAVVTAHGFFHVQTLASSLRMIVLAAKDR